MLSFFNFSRGEWSAVILIAIIILGGFLFSSLYEIHIENHFDNNLYKEKIELFIQKQEYLTDSIETARENRKNQSYNYSVNKTKNHYKNYYSEYYPKEYPDDSSKISHQHQSKKREKGYEIVKIEINYCDTSDITRVPLFGAKRAAKLVEYRQQLGGFYSLEQIGEVYILQSISTEHLEKYFTINTDYVEKIKINQANYKEMIKHPYFDAYLTKSIIHYREKNGAIKDIDEFRKATNAYPELIEKVKYYLSFE